ncbi:MAG: aminotransferase class I/II-fold pyridoxal phosphate-dependent enzyme [Selenomonadaceae bacterium]|nr:aminotransferase class I/II-fold pyridoxal phosphate-dependent enzyme [Selenomonadaceae bacterium]
MILLGMAASHSADRKLYDAIFEANAACQKAISQHGADKVTNATIGVALNEAGELALLPTMETVYRSLPMKDLSAYAPIAGLPEYLDAVVDFTFADNKPAGYIAAVATASGTGAIHHAIANYAERGDFVLTSDWYWGNYNIICNETGKSLTTFKLFDEDQKFNLKSFTEKVDTLLKNQNSLLIVLNTPAHNPTGFALSEEDWDNVLSIAKTHADKGKNISILVDIAYIDFGGEKNAVRRFMTKFSSLPSNIMTLFSFSMSKSFTMYGQRTGALIAVSSSKEVIDEFKEVSKYSNRAVWSNINRGAQAFLAKLHQDKTALAALESERNQVYQMVQKRANVFVEEAKQCGLNFLPYKGGFFISVPADNPVAICDRLHEDLIFAVPLKLGIRIAACSVSLAKMSGIAAKVKAAFDKV